MGSFIARQPTGLLCRFSSIVDTITDYNMTDNEYIEMCAEKAREDAREVLTEYLQPYQQVKDRFIPRNMTPAAFKKIVSKMEAKQE